MIKEIIRTEDVVIGASAVEATFSVPAGRSQNWRLAPNIGCYVNIHAKADSPTAAIGDLFIEAGLEVTLTIGPLQTISVIEETAGGGILNVAEVGPPPGMH